MSSSQQILSYIAFGLNLVGAIILIGALIPPFLETVKSKKTYPIGDKFFLFYTLGGVFLFVNAIVNIATISGVDRILFGVFAVVQIVSITLNSYILKVKRKNMKDAAAKGMTEQDYYEQILKPSIER